MDSSNTRPNPADDLALDSRTLAAYRAEMPITDEPGIYLNHAGVAPTSRRTCYAVTDWMLRLAGRGTDFDRWERRSDHCRELFARLVGCRASEVAFVRNTSHGLALVAEGIDWRPGNRIVVADRRIEYPSNFLPWRHVARARDLRVDEVPATDGGYLDPQAIADTVGSGARLLAVSSAQFGSVAVADLAELGDLCRRTGTLLCVDGIQTVGALATDVEALGIDFLSADSHKWMLGMSGIGALYVRQRWAKALRPALVGWKSVQGAWDFDARNEELWPDARRFEEGSQPYALVDGLAAALELLHEVTVPRIEARLVTLVRRLAAGLQGLGCAVGPPPPLRRHILTFTHPRWADAGRLADELGRRGIHLAARKGRLRVAPHFYNTEAEMDRLVEAVADLDPP